jgi:hypothetical protein
LRSTGAADLTIAARSLNRNWQKGIDDGGQQAAQAARSAGGARLARAL